MALRKKRSCVFDSDQAVALLPAIVVPLATITMNDAYPFQLTKSVEQFLEDHETYLLLGHKEPDGDCLGAPLALASFLRRRGKQVHTYCEGPFSRPEIASFESSFSAQVDPADRAGDAAAIILDCSTVDRTGHPGEGIVGLPSLVIDHHASGDPFGDIRLIQPTVPATALIVQFIIEMIDGKLTREEAELILFATCTDTGFFRHLRTEAGFVFRAVARLIDAGASTEDAYQRMFGARSFERRVMLGRMLARTERLHSGLLLYTTQSARDREEVGEAGRGDDDLYTLLQTVAGAEVLLVIREKHEGECSLSLRSTTSVDVGSVAHKLGGGGHPQAAGCAFFGSVEQAKEATIALLTPQLRQLKQKR